MQIYQGKSVFSGIAIGKIRVYKKNERQVKRVKVENPDAEMARFEEAKAKGIAQLGVLYEKACKEVGEANAAIFEVHQMIQKVFQTRSCRLLYCNSPEPHLNSAYAPFRCGFSPYGIPEKSTHSCKHDSHFFLPFRMAL